MSASNKNKRVCIGLTELSYNRFEAERKLNDHCLNSTVSTLQNRHGIPIERKWETVPGYLGNPTRVCRNWIAKENIERALKLARFWG